MTAIERKQAIAAALQACTSEPLYEAGMGVLRALGYKSKLTLKANGLKTFRETFDQQRRLKDKPAKTDEWKHIEFLCQITGDDLTASTQGARSFQVNYQPNEIQSYVFVAIELTGVRYSRAELSQITRAVNRIFDMPAMIFFKHGNGLTVGIINRRLHKKDEAKDVLEKVTLIKDIDCADPLRAHIEILHDLSSEALYEDFHYHNFLGLHQAWEKRLASYQLNERFYREIANWYFFAVSSSRVILPRSIENIPDPAEKAKQRSIFFIRLLTRLIFCWFLQEKGLIPRDLFRKRVAGTVLADFSPEAGSYYKAILQNLFFATLNREQEKRGWRKKYPGSRDGNRGITTLWRHQDLLAAPDELESLLRNKVPFVNGGLFDCLDDTIVKPNVRLDDFSEEVGNHLCLPNDLFFGPEHEVDLSDVYEDKRHKKEKVSGLIEILSRYKFTVEENTPLEEEIALDPELLGKVFENLLASYNEDTGTTARKALGAFYTPRAIVSYMVDESLRSYLGSQVPTVPEKTLRSLFSQESDRPRLSQNDRNALVAAIGRIKIVDPACGSGAFPMGALHRLVDLLRKLDPNNESWKRDRLAEAEQYYELLRQADAPTQEQQECAARIDDIRHSFDTRFHALDFARKLYLIENCIFGVDVQPIACQIAKLRFFIALMVDQNVDPGAPNFGVRPLPNLETKIVAADALIPLEKPDGQMGLVDQLIAPIRRDLEKVRHRHFNARTPASKAKCRAKDMALRAQVADLLKQNGMPADNAQMLAAWDPYDQNHAAGFFDSEWMFGVRVGKVWQNGSGSTTIGGKLALINDLPGQTEILTAGEADSGFDIVLGNPPYVRIQTLKQQNPKLVAFYKEHYVSAKKGNYDLYVVFVEAGLRLLNSDGHLAFILPHKFFNAQYGEPLRGLLAQGRHLQHVVHFGHQQVFPGATNYVCLLFLANAGADGCRFVAAANIASWLKTLTGPEETVPWKEIGAAEWNFAVGRDGFVFKKLASMRPTLEQVAAKIFQGLVTGADPVFILRATDQPGVYASDATNQIHIIEQELMHPLCKGALDIHRWHVGALSKAILFPYRIVDGRAELIAVSEFERLFPDAWAYLLLNRKRLESRENGKWKHPRWYALGRSQNLSEMEQPKLLTPSIGAGASFAYDANNFYYFIGSGAGGGGGYGITLAKTGHVEAKFILGLLNSSLLDWFLKQISSVFRGGYYAFSKQFIENLPIAPATDDQKALIVSIVDSLLWLYAFFDRNPEVKTARDGLMLGYWEQVLNGLTYELYFTKEVHARSIQLFEMTAKSSLPSVNQDEQTNQLDGLRADFERLYDLNHPLRAALHDVQTIEEVRIIEGQR